MNPTNKMSKVVFITGGSDGIGFELCKKFEKNGWKVFATSTSQNGLNKIKEISSSCDGAVCDIRIEAQIDAAVNEAVKKFLKIDVLVNNAGIKAKGRVEDFDIEKLKEVIEINFIGHFSLSKKIITIMKKQGFGRIINISSTLGIETPPEYSPYVASKHALAGFSKSLMREVLKDNILVSTVYPGGTNTSLHDTPREDYLLPQDVAEAIFFVASRPDNVLVSELIITPISEKNLP